MNKNNGYFFLLIAFGVGILLGHFLSSSAQDNHTQPAFLQDAKIHALEAQLSEANRKISAQQQAALASALPATSASTHIVKPETAIANPSQQPVSDNQKIKDLEAQLGTQKAKEMTQWLVDGYARKRGFDPGDVMQKRFDEEQVNSLWAKEQENKLLTAFSSQPELAEFALLETKCKSSLCQVSFSFTDMAQAEQIADRVAKGSATIGNVNSIFASPNTEKKITTVFISLANEQSATN